MTAVEKKTYRVIGARPIRPDGVEKVTGKALFGADARPAGLIYGKILRSPHAHARIISIDTSEAEAVPGVLAVMTASDLPAASDEVQALGETAVNLKELSDNVLASDKVLYRGHAVAAVAAVSVHVAEQAARRIRVQYEPLPVVLDVREAMLDDAPLLNENLFTRSMGKVVSD
ncbi:xanthine dehydrogenase family protein molybdopterin-binding subunit, partial [bacterium]